MIWALWRLACGYTAVGRADAEHLYCPVCQCDTAVTERTAWVIPVAPEEP